MTTASALFQVLQNSTEEDLFWLKNVPGHETKPLTALVMFFPDSSQVRLVYGPELGMVQIGTTSVLEDKLLWLVNEMGDDGSLPQALVLPAYYVHRKDSTMLAGKGHFTLGKVDLETVVSDASLKVVSKKIYQHKHFLVCIQGIHFFFFNS